MKVPEEPVEETAQEPAAEPIYVEAEPEIIRELPEAGGVAWTELHGKKTDAAGIVHEIKINVTARGFTSLEALQDLLVTLKTAAEGLNMYPYSAIRQSPQGNNSAQAPATSAAPAAGAKIPPPAQQASNEPVYENEGGGGLINAVQMGVTPRQDGKTKVDFYEVGHRYPDISCVLTPEQLAEMLKPTGGWTPSHFQSIGTYSGLAYKITWQNSTRTNQYGKPYKNIMSVSL